MSDKFPETNRQLLNMTSRFFSFSLNCKFKFNVGLRFILNPVTRQVKFSKQWSRIVSLGPTRSVCQRRIQIKISSYISKNKNARWPPGTGIRLLKSYREDALYFYQLILCVSFYVFYVETRCRTPEKDGPSLLHLQRNSIFCISTYSNYLLYTYRNVWPGRVHRNRRPLLNIMSLYFVFLYTSLAFSAFF